MKNQDFLFHQELHKLKKLTRQYIDLSGKDESIKSLHQQLEQFLPTELSEDSDSISFIEPGVNGTTSMKKTVFGSFKIYTVAQDDNPSAIAQKFGFTLNRLAELQHPLFRQVLKLTQEVSLNNEAYRKIKPKDIIKDFWKNGQGKLWTLTKGDELLIQEPSLEFLKKIKFFLSKKRTAHKNAVNKKQEKETEANGTQIFDRDVHNDHDRRKITTHAKHFMEVTGLFKLLGAINLNLTGKLTFSSKAKKAFQKSLIGIKEIVGSRNVVESISVDVVGIPSAKVDQYFEGLDYVGKIYDAIEKAIKSNSKEDQVIAEGIRTIINQMLKKEGKNLLPPLGHDFYKKDGNYPMYLPSRRYTNPQLFFMTSGRPLYQYDNDTQTLYYEMGPKEMKSVGFKNMAKK